MDNIIRKETEYLFNCEFYADDFDEGEHEDEHRNRCENLFEQYLWKDIFPYWEEYFDINCNTPEEVINFANLYFYYDAHEFPIPDPYGFAAKFYSKVDLNVYADDALDIFDSIFITMFKKAGLINLSKNPDYVPDQDPILLERVKELKTK